MLRNRDKDAAHFRARKHILEATCSVQRAASTLARLEPVPSACSSGSASKVGWVRRHAIIVGGDCSASILVTTQKICLLILL